MMVLTRNLACADEIIPLPITRPLCVDLDGTLVKNDTLVDSLMILVRKYPLEALKVPLWVLGGKAALKGKVSSIVSLDVGNLPYNRALLSYLHEQRGEGREIYLTTGADNKLATRVANHLGIFTDVVASDGSRNLTGRNKLASLKHRFDTGFDYVGNARPDLPLLAAAGESMLANPDRSTSTLVRTGKIAISRTFEDRKPLLKAILKAVRPHQWAKNVLIVVPLLLAHSLKLQAVGKVILAFACFTFCASASYIVNDLLDVEADRQHPEKRFRPFAAGDLPASTGLAIALTFLVSAFIAAANLLSSTLLGWLLFYTATTLVYSLFLKRVVLVDVILLSALYTLRLLAGGAAAEVKISPWLGGFSVFLFLSLAMVKRFSELQNNRAQGYEPSSSRGYLLTDIEQLRSFGTASAYAAVVVFSLYINSHDVVALYSHAARMWLMVPLMVLWISRVWLLAGRGQLDEDPVIFAVTDPTSLMIGFCVAVIAVLAM